jgi:hypothetical protein
MKLINLLSVLVYLGNRFSSLPALAKPIQGVLSNIGTSFLVTTGRDAPESPCHKDSKSNQQALRLFFQSLPT